MEMFEGFNIHHPCVVPIISNATHPTFGNRFFMVYGGECVKPVHVISGGKRGVLLKGRVRVDYERNERKK